MIFDFLLRPAHRVRVVPTGADQGGAVPSPAAPPAIQAAVDAMYGDAMDRIERTCTAIEDAAKLIVAVVSGGALIALAALLWALL